MLPRLHRIDGVQLKQTLPRSRSNPTDWGIVRIHPHTLTRLTCIVSKKIARKAHDRNRIKRKIYHAVQPLLTHIPPGLYYIFPNREVLHIRQSDLVDKITLWTQSLKKNT